MVSEIGLLQVISEVICAIAELMVASMVEAFVALDMGNEPGNSAVFDVVKFAVIVSWAYADMQPPTQNEKNASILERRNPMHGKPYRLHQSCSNRNICISR